MSHLLHAAQDTRLVDVGHVDEDIIGRVAIERRLQSLLVEMVTNETNAATKNEETVEGTNLDVFISLFGGEGTAIAEQVDEADSNTAVDVEDELRVSLSENHLS